MPEITDHEFTQFQRFIHGAAGISLDNGKKALVSGRLARRLTARQLSSYGEYGLGRIQHLPAGYLERFCLKGCGPYAGTFLINERLREKVRFQNINLNATLPHIGAFEIVDLNLPVRCVAPAIYQKA